MNKAGTLVEDIAAKDKLSDVLGRDKEVSSKPKITQRMSVRELMKPENKKKKNAFLRAWKLIKELPPSNPNSFWAIAGFHGMPLKDPRYPKGSGQHPKYPWGGWCQHANVLFPSWHRFYVWRLEQALQTLCPNDDIAMAYWDQTSKETWEEGIPTLLTDEYVEIDGKRVENPLRSYKLQLPIENDEEVDHAYYKRPVNYETKRFPYSGIVSGSERAKTVAKEHNEKMRKLFPATPTPGRTITDVEILNFNMKHYIKLNKSKYPTDIVEYNPDGYGVFDGFVRSLYADTYNVMSNIDSAGAEGWTAPIERPHNYIHLAIGGLTEADLDLSPLEMRERDIAAILQGNCKNVLQTRVRVSY